MSSSFISLEEHLQSLRPKPSLHPDWSTNGTARLLWRYPAQISELSAACAERGHQKVQPFAEGAYAIMVKTADGGLLRFSHQQTEEAKFPRYNWPIFFQPVQDQTFIAGNCVVERFCELPRITSYRQHEIMPLLSVVRQLGYDGEMTFDANGEVLRRSGGVMEELKHSNLCKLKDGTLIIVDKSIGTPRAHDPARKIDWSHWVLPDGTWKQHRDYPQILGTGASAVEEKKFTRPQGGAVLQGSQLITMPA